MFAFRIIAITIFLFANFASAQSNLPPQVRADLLKQRIVEEYDSKKLEKILSSMDEYYILEDQGMDIPAPLRLLDAESSFALARYSRALCALEAYLNNADRESDGYARALKNYDSYISASKKAESAAGPPKDSDYCNARRKAKEVRELAINPPQPAKIFFLRGHNRKIGYAWNMLVGADSRVLGTLPNSSVVEIKVDPGSYKFFARWQPDEPSSPDTGELSLEVSAGVSYYLRAYCDKNSFTRAPINIEKMDESTARQSWQLP